MTPNLPDSPPALRTLDDWLSHCERLHPAGIDLTLARVAEVWARAGVVLGTPLGQEDEERAAPVVFTVAGTNGKGSTCAMLEGILLKAGFRVGVYGSPHLVHFEERCRIMGELVKADELVPHFAAIEAARGDAALTYFEFTTLAILRLLASSELDVVILEVGLGGRLDAVNVIDTDCAIITSIDLDHMDYLGPDREAIGREKAGIMRAGRPVVVSDPQPPPSVTDQAQQPGADRCGRGPCARAGPRWSCRDAAGSVRCSPPWCWMWRTTRMRRRLWRPTSIRWVSSRAPMWCGARWPTRT